MSAPSAPASPAGHRAGRRGALAARPPRPGPAARPADASASSVDVPAVDVPAVDVPAVDVPAAPAVGAAPRTWTLRCGAHLLYLAGIAALYYNSGLAGTTWQLVVQAALLPLVVAAVVLRVRLPYALAVLGLAGIAAGTLSVFLVGVLSLAMRRSGPLVWFVALAGSTVLTVQVALTDLAAHVHLRETLLSVVPTALILGIGPLVAGRYVRAHRRLQASVAERATRELLDRELAAQRAAHAERERIAREMHDSLGHRLALVTVQAGALEMSATDPEIAAAAERIRSSARSGLADLRAVVHALGEDAGRDSAPGLAAVPALVEASRRAGADVTLADGSIDGSVDPSALAPEVGRLVHRAVQEALTNAHRHAPGAPVAVAVSRTADAGVEVTVGNPLAPGGERGAGTGLAELRRRVEAAGGHLAASAADDRFELTVRLPGRVAS